MDEVNESKQIVLQMGGALKKLSDDKNIITFRVA